MIENSSNQFDKKSAFTLNCNFDRQIILGQLHFRQFRKIRFPMRVRKFYVFLFQKKQPTSHKELSLRTLFRETQQVVLQNLSLNTEKNNLFLHLSTTCGCQVIDVNNETETAIRVQILQMKSRSDLFSPMSKKKTFYKEKPLDERSKGRNEPDSFNEACAGISGKILSNGTF